MGHLFDYGNLGMQELLRGFLREQLEWRRAREKRLLAEGNTGQRQNGSQFVDLAFAAGDTSGATLARDVLRLSAEAADNPQVAALTLYREQRERSLVATEDFMVRAAVSWGAGKSNQRLICDYHHGTRLVLDCSSFVISAQMIRNSVAPFVAQVPTQKVSASAVYGTLSTPRWPLTLTEFPLAAVAPSGSAIYEVPPFARAFVVLSQQGTTTAAAEIRSQKGGVSMVNMVITPAQEVVLPNGAEEVRLFVTVPGAGATYQLIWILGV